MSDYEPSGPWGVWWHPVKCFRAIVEIRERVAVIEEEREVRNREIQNFMQRITDTQTLLDEARGEITTLRGTLAERNVALADAEARIRQLTAELEEMQAVEKQIEEFNKMLSQAEDMKQRYEKRIGILRGKLKEYEDQAQINDELSIDMGREPGPATRRSVRYDNRRSPGVKATGLPGIPPRVDDESAQEGEWLETLDEI